MSFLERWFEEDWNNNEKFIDEMTHSDSKGSGLVHPDGKEVTDLSGLQGVLQNLPLSLFRHPRQGGRYRDRGR